MWEGGHQFGEAGQAQVCFLIVLKDSAHTLDDCTWSCRTTVGRTLQFYHTLDNMFRFRVPQHSFNIGPVPSRQYAFLVVR